MTRISHKKGKSKIGYIPQEIRFASGNTLIISGDTNAQSLKSRADKARDFPMNTCPASRHVQEMGERLIRDGNSYWLTDDPAQAGESMLAVVAALWEARSEIARLKVEK